VFTSLRAFRITGINTLPGCTFLDGAVVQIAHGGMTEEVILNREELLELMHALDGHRIHYPSELNHRTFVANHNSAADAVDELLVCYRRVSCGLANDQRDPESAIHFGEIYLAITEALAKQQTAPDLRLFERQRVFGAMGCLLGFHTEQDPVDGLLRDIVRGNPKLTATRREHDRFRDVCAPGVVRFVIQRGDWPFDQEVWYVALVPSGTTPVLIEKARGWLPRW
jgi:hypothetical protein